MNIEFFKMLFIVCTSLIGALVVLDWLLGLIIKLYYKIK